MKSIRWYHILCLFFVILVVCVAPVVFTQSALFGWEAFDLSDKGTIGDTIGGITAPIVGLLSVLLLWLTLRAQQTFNEKQDSINKEQQKFNDANRILAMESHILHLDENLNYGYTGFGRTLEGHGVSSLRLLEAGNQDIAIARSELEYIIDRVHVIETGVCSMVDYLGKSHLEIEEKEASYGMAEMYLSHIVDFYSNVINQRIKLFLAVEDLHWEEIGAENPNVIMIDRTRSYQERVTPYLVLCHQNLAK